MYGDGMYGTGMDVYLHGCTGMDVFKGSGRYVFMRHIVDGAI